MLAPPPVVIPLVPFYSQFQDIHTLSWQKVGCGVASLAMVIDYYSTSTISVDALLKEGVALGAYDTQAGWIYAGLISLAKKYGLQGVGIDVSTLTKDASLSQLQTYLASGPVMVSIYYKFDPKSKIPHLIVLDGIKDGLVYYNDPAALTGQKTISVTDFQKGWKKRFIVIRPNKAKTSTV